MKVKLLKQVRKRFAIVYFPNGFGHYSDKQIMVLFENDDVMQHINVNDVNTKSKAYDTLYSYLKDLILKRYKKYGVRRLNKNGQIEKLWHKLN